MTVDRTDWHGDGAEEAYRDAHGITGELTEEAADKPAEAAETKAAGKPAEQPPPKPEAAEKKKTGWLRSLFRRGK